MQFAWQCSYTSWILESDAAIVIRAIQGKPGMGHDQVVVDTRWYQSRRFVKQNGSVCRPLIGMASFTF